VNALPLFVPCAAGVEALLAYEVAQITGLPASDLKTLRGGVHLQASWIFTTNDMLVNSAIAVSGLAVILFNSPYPDLIIGLGVVIVVVRSGFEILEKAGEAGEKGKQHD